MASGGVLKEICEEVSCSVCLDLFRDPVILPECGHNFCRECLAQSWGESGDTPPYSCPQCRRKTQKRKLCPNQQLANVVEIAKRFRPLEREGAEGEGGVCKKHQEPLRFFCREDEAPLCLVCSRSPEHKDHQMVPLEEAAGEKQTTVAPRKERVCQKHQEPLKRFCRYHEAPLCVVCEQSQEHKYHEIVPAEEAAQEYKDKFFTCVEILQKERNKILANQTRLVKESQDLLKQTKGEQQKTLIKFRQLHIFLDKQEKLLLAQMEEVEKEVEKKRDQQLAELSEELSSLDSLIREMEEKSQQPPGDLLQDARSTLQRYEEKEAFEKPATFSLASKWRVWDVSDLTFLLEGLKQLVKDILDFGLHLHKVNLTLDPYTAHPTLILSDGQRSVHKGEEYEYQPDNPERFDECPVVLGCEEFTEGRHYWEVLVESEEGWSLGVVRKSVQRKGWIGFTPEDGIWGMGKWAGRFQTSRDDYELQLSLTGKLKKIRVCLNYAGGRLAFFDADTATLLYEFSDAYFFGETLLPFFWVSKNGYLTISA